MDELRNIDMEVKAMLQQVEYDDGCRADRNRWEQEAWEDAFARARGLVVGLGAIAFTVGFGGLLWLVGWMVRGFQ